MKKQQKAAIYCRVSTIHQVDKYSLPVQKEALISYAQHVLHIASYEIFQDAGFSGKNTKRPAYQDMISRCRSGEFTHILVYKLDRISRSVLDFSLMYNELQKLGVTFISLNDQFDTSTPMGRAMLTISLTFAQMEREVTSERVGNVMLARAKKGIRVGGAAPLGYDWDKTRKTLVINEEEAQTVRYIFSCFKKTHVMYQVMLSCNSQRILTKSGHVWSVKKIRAILTNSVYKGSLVYNRTSTRGKWRRLPPSEWIVVENIFPVIIPPAEFDAIQNYIATRPKPIKLSKRIHLYGKLLYCPCGSCFTARKDKPRACHPIGSSLYTCLSHVLDRGCKESYTPSDIKLTPFIFRYIQNMLYVQSHIDTLQSPSQLESLLLQGDELAAISHVIDLQVIFNSIKKSHRVDYQPPTTIPLQPFQPNNDAKRNRIERALQRLKDLYLYDDESISRDEYVSEKKRLLAQLQALDIPAKPAVPEPSISAAMQNDNLKKLLTGSASITYDILMAAVGEKIAFDFVHAIITKINIENRRIHSITFKNGITHEFIYATH